MLEITKDFFNFICKAIDWVKYNLIEIGFAYPVDSSPEYREWLKEILTETFRIEELKINFLDEATANCLGLVYLKNFEINLDKYYLIIDIGGGTTDCAILQFRTLDGKNVDIFSLDGLCYRQNGGVIENKHARIDNLEEIPIPSRDLFDYDYNMSLDCNNYKADFIMTSRGCPASCSFCSASRMFPGGVRLRSVSEIQREIEFIISRKNIQALKIFDSTFTIS